ncbi:TPA: hypothetical protein HA338_03165 [Methanosarcina acetivorans]|uniref:Uncharacterized protein n=1 Tax=Methanosarcina acetivorans TaxID=2214 RepID=A0A832W992_9EURY|nr:hypothetical protein [Methanosarcina acetivorans]HIH93065.1 hypothetical protein [Methanosarcina acetivorans]
MSAAKKTSCCCTASATPRKSPISCDPEAKLGLQSHNPAAGTKTAQYNE